MAQRARARTAALRAHLALRCMRASAAGAAAVRAAAAAAAAGVAARGIRASRHREFQRTARPRGLHALFSAIRQRTFALYAYTSHSAEAQLQNSPERRPSPWRLLLQGYFAQLTIQRTSTYFIIKFSQQIWCNDRIFWTGQARAIHPCSHCTIFVSGTCSTQRSKLCRLSEWIVCLIFSFRDRLS